MNKVALITGGAKGIGKAICLELAKNNYDIVINYLTSKKEAEALSSFIIDKYHVRCSAFKADVSKEDEVISMINEIDSKLGGVDILINNAAVDLSTLYNLKKIEDFRRTLDVNVVGAFICSREASKHMLEKKWGRIINISSTNGIDTCQPISLEYDASKAALNSLTHNLAIKYAPYINVNAIAPGFIGTESELDGYDDDFLKEETDKILKKRYGYPEDVAYLVKFLVSDEADYINGSIIRIDGGKR